MKNKVDNNKMSDNHSKMDNRVVWLDFLMFAASVFLQGFHTNWIFYIAGGLAIVIAVLGIFCKFLPLPFFIARGSLSSRENRLVWLAFLMFAAGLFFQGFHCDVGFWIAGGLGLLVGSLGFISGQNWERLQIPKTKKNHR